MEVVASEITPDGNRVNETLSDGSQASRPPSLGEQVLHMKDEVLSYVVKMLPAAHGGSIILVTDEGGGVVEMTMTLSGSRIPVLPREDEDDEQPKPKVVELEVKKPAKAEEPKAKPPAKKSK